MFDHLMNFLKFHVLWKKINKNSKMGDKKILLAKYLSYPGNTKITKINFLMNFVQLPPELAFKKNLNQPVQPVIVTPTLLNILHFEDPT
jgi:hypothetical protein